MTTAESVTTWSRKLQHYARSEALAPQRYGAKGRGLEGKTLCGESGMDQARVDGYDEEFWVTRKKPLVVAELPECKRCARILATEGATR